MNVILIILDSLRKDHVGVYGSDRVKTPSLDALATQSLRFTQPYPESIPTIPARRAIHTGLRTWPFRNWVPPKGETFFPAGWQPIPEEQTTLSEVLHSMMEPAATAATGSTGSQSNPSSMNMPPMQMDASAHDMMQKMQNQQAGAEFDTMYLRAQLQGHRDLLQVQERYLQSNPQNREHTNVAKMARGHIREHIAMLEEMQKTLR